MKNKILFRSTVYLTLIVLVNAFILKPCAYARGLTPLEGRAILETDGRLLFTRCENGVWDKVSNNIWTLKEAGVCQIFSAYSILPDQIQQITDSQFVWEPLGHIIGDQVLALRETKLALTGESKDDQEIFLIDKNQMQTRIMSIAYPWVYDFTVSPKGDSFLINSNNTIQQFNMQTKQLTDLTSKIGRAFSTTWSSSGDILYYRKFEDRNLYSYDFTKDKEHQLTSFNPPGAQIGGIQQRLSKDNSMLVVLYSEPVGTAVRYSLWIMNADGENKKKIADYLDTPQDFIFSNDNTMVFYTAIETSGTQDGKFEVFSVNLETLETKKVIKSASGDFYLVPRIYGWSDDGKALLINYSENPHLPNQTKSYLAWLNVTTGVVQDLF